MSGSDTTAPISLPSNYGQILQLAQKYHAGQTRASEQPYWHHCDRVARLLARTLQQTGEGSKALREAGILAAVGHDLYEDTDIERSEIVDAFGAEVDALIEEMTNRQGDDDLSQYLEKLKRDSEMGRLIKLSDMTDNSLSAGYAANILTPKWLREFLVPLQEAQWEVVGPSTFEEFPQTAERLKGLVEFGLFQLRHAAE